MLNISDELKNIYRNDNLPIVSELAYKELRLYFPNLGLVINNNRIVNDSFSLQESLCSSDDLTLGSCEGAMLKITVANLIQDLSGHEFIITQIVNGKYEMPLGTYQIKSCKKQNDLWFREIVAYNSMIKTNADVSKWYNNLEWPQTVKSMRESLLSYLGIEFENQTLTNDTVILDKTISPSGLVAREVLSKLCEISAGFGHITRCNKFKVIQLSGLGLYPSETLYPTEDLFPSESGEYITTGYKSTEYEEYIVEPITSVTVREDDSDYGTTAGIEGNPYIIEGNYLLFGKSSMQIQAIADNILLQLKNKFYRPHNTVMIGLPYLEVGDSVSIITDGDAVESFIFERTLKGIQSLQDEISASGNKKRNQQVGLNTQVKQLKGKTLRIVKTIEELSSTMTDVEQGLESKITQTAGQISQSVTDIKNDLQGQIDIQAGIIDLKVDNKGIIQAINLSKEGIKIDASKLSITGYVEFNDLSTPGATYIHGSNLKTGTVTADTVRASWVYAGNISADQIKAGAISGDRINGGTISGVTITSPSSQGNMTMANGILSSQLGAQKIQISAAGLLLELGSETNASIGQTGVFGKNIMGDSGNITTLKCSTINGYTPIHSGNIGSQTVSRANTATSASSASSASSLSGVVRVSGNSNLIPDMSGVYNGTSGNPWAGGYATGAWATTSDERKKHNISELDERYVRFAKMITPRMYQMFDGKSGRYHTGLIAQEVEQAMIECGISDMEFAGLVKAPVYERKHDDGEYDTTSEVIDYDYFLRYDEFIPLIFLLLNQQ